MFTILHLVWKRYHMMKLKTFVFLFTACILCTMKADAAFNPCRYGEPLHGAYCGRGGHPCPTFYACKVAPTDAYAVCCPNYCKSGVPVMDANGDPVHCGRGGMTCPDTYTCQIAPNDAWAVCCPTI